MTSFPTVRAGNLLFVSGTTAVDDQLHVVGRNDIVAQTKFIFERFCWIVERASVSFANIVDDQIFPDNGGLKAYRRHAPQILQRAVLSCGDRCFGGRTDPQDAVIESKAMTIHASGA
jgi:enamine deaminase RidA (YjgF/YER057c/UK114 family)